MKKNIIICTLLVAIILLVGYIVYDNITLHKDVPACECNCKTKDINANQKVNIKYFVSDYSVINKMRISMELYSIDNNFGTFSLIFIDDTGMTKSINGNYDTKLENTLRLTFNLDNDGVNALEDLGANISMTDMDNWRLAALSYKDSEITIGNIKLYMVNK